MTQMMEPMLKEFREEVAITKRVLDRLLADKTELEATSEVNVAGGAGAAYRDGAGGPGQNLTTRRV